MPSDTRSAAAFVLGASFVLALGLYAVDLGHSAWYLSRASGLVAFAVLTASVLTGLLVTTKAAEPGMPRPLTFDLHQFLSSLVLTFLAIHAGALLFDDFLRFAPGDILIPFRGSYVRFWTGLGIVSAWIAVAVTASSWVVGRIGRRRWRLLHYTSFAAYLMALGHGLGAGTDTGLALVQWLYILSAALVAALVAYRVAALMLTPRDPRLPRASGARWV